MSPQRKGIYRSMPYPPTCLLCSCQDGSFKPRCKADSPCPRINTRCNRYSYEKKKKKILLWSAISPEALYSKLVVWILAFTLCLAWSLIRFHLYTHSDPGYWGLLWSHFCLCFLSNWAFWTSSLPFQLKFPAFSMPPPPLYPNPWHKTIGAKLGFATY